MITLSKIHVLTSHIEPLGQILAAVGLLLSGVLGIVGRLVSTISSRRIPFNEHMLTRSSAERTRARWPP